MSRRCAKKLELKPYSQESVLTIPSWLKPSCRSASSSAFLRSSGAFLLPHVPPRAASVAVFGAGIAGLTVAHELTRRGHAVHVYEASEEAGGFFRSAHEGGIPTEYSWHGMGPWYHNLFDLLTQIPFDETSSVYDKSLSRPIDFGMVPDGDKGVFDHTRLLDVRNLFRFTRMDLLRWTWLTLKTWTSRRRSEEVYAAINAAEAYRRILSDRGWKTWRAGFGPWVGSDWTNVSLHQVGLFFRKQLFTWPTHEHRADASGPAWTQGPRSGWLVLRGPSSEYWFDKWVAYLQDCGVQFTWEGALHALAYDGTVVTGAELASGERVSADLYVLATNPFAAEEILARTPPLAALDQLRNFAPLVADGPHTQVSFRLAFNERIRWPSERIAVVIADSEFNLTLFAEEQVWGSEVDLGDGIQSLWTGTACVATRPGRLYGLPLVNCTKEQFIEEVKAQLASCGGLDALLREANDGRTWTDFTLVRVEVWHEWIFSTDGIRTKQPKWVNTTHTQRWLPDQKTPVPNLVLAGAHTRTDADVWSIEGAVESGRRAARLIEPAVEVKPVWVPAPLRILQRMDDALYAVGAPHVLDVLLVGALATVTGLLVWRLAHGQVGR